MIAWTIYITFAGAVLLLFMPRALSRWIALATAAGGFAVSLAAFFNAVDVGTFKTIVRIPWVPILRVEFHLAGDGISLTLALVTSLTAVSAVLFSWDVNHRQNEFFFWLLLVVGGSYGVFLSADLFLLFVFYELVIVPKYFLIAIWGSTNKEYGAMKLTLYSFFGGALVFIGIIAAYVTAGSLNLHDLAEFPFPSQFQSWAFPVLFLGFAVLAGIWPLHTWAPTGHVAAPTAGSMLLAGIVMKLGAYGGLRWARNLFPEGFHQWSKGIALRRGRANDLSPHPPARSRRSVPPEPEPRPAVRGILFRHRLGRVDGHPGIQRVCRGNHDPDRRMESVSDSGLDHRRRDGAGGRVHAPRAE